jgi:hypothetical protein
MHASSFQQKLIAGIAIALSALFAAGCKQVPQNASAPEAQVPSAAASAPAAAAAASAPGRISIQQWPNLTIDGKPLRAAPGARIVNSNSNLMMTPNMVPDGARVQYELDGTGQVRLIRVLDPK